MSVMNARLLHVSHANESLLLIDGHSLAYRAFFALPVENFSTTTGQSTNAVYGFTSMLINMLRDEEPTHVGVAFDLSRQTFRTEAYEEYKATRSATPERATAALTRSAVATITTMSSLKPLNASSGWTTPTASAVSSAMIAVTS